MKELQNVKRIRGFYSHALVYVVVNAMILIINAQSLDSGETFFHWRNFSTLLFWGIGLLAHGLSVFMPYIVLGRNWEEKKIKELMDKDKNSRWE